MVSMKNIRNHADFNFAWLRMYHFKPIVTIYAD